MPRYFRRVIRIAATDSPNVRLGLAQEAAGEAPTDEVVVPGVLTYSDYKKRRATWDPVRQCIGLDGRFYEGRENLLYPPDWLDAAERAAEGLAGRKRRAEAVGVDPAEGGDKTVWAVVDRWGLIELRAERTEDTTVVTRKTKGLMVEWKVPPGRVVFDLGGGGKEHVDRLRLEGFEVRGVSFGAAPHLPPRRMRAGWDDKLDAAEDKQVYTNLRAQMYWELREKLNPNSNPDGFGLPALFTDLRAQLAPIPLYRTEEGGFLMPPKSRKGRQVGEDGFGADGFGPGGGGSGGGGRPAMKTLRELLGRSPDEADALVLAVYAMDHEPEYVRIGVS